MEDFPIWMKLIVYAIIGGTVLYGILAFVNQTYLGS
jgi:hypothetical protein